MHFGVGSQLIKCMKTATEFTLLLQNCYTIFDSELAMIERSAELRKPSQCNLCNVCKEY